MNERIDNECSESTISYLDISQSFTRLHQKEKISVEIAGNTTNVNKPWEGN